MQRDYRNLYTLEPRGTEAATSLLSLTAEIVQLPRFPSYYPITRSESAQLSSTSYDRHCECGFAHVGSLRL